MSVVKAGVLEGSSDSEEEVHVYKLKIHDTGVKDAGEWRVEVADKYGSTSTSCNLAILDDSKSKPADTSDVEKFSSVQSSSTSFRDSQSRPCRPKFITHLRDQNVEEGFCVKFQCIVTGTPPPKIEWFRDLEPITKSSFVHMAYRGDGTAFLQLFSPVADRDKGRYKCVARNSEGSCFSEAHLTIQKQITNADLRDQFSISRARTRNEELANFTGHHISKFQEAERMLLKSDQYTYEASPHLKKSELYHLDPHFKGYRKSDIYHSEDVRRKKKFEAWEYSENMLDRKNVYNVENDYKPRKSYQDDGYDLKLKGKVSEYEFEKDYIPKKTYQYSSDYKIGGKKDKMEDVELQRKLTSKKLYDSLTYKSFAEKQSVKPSVGDYSNFRSRYIPRRELSDEINPGLSNMTKDRSRGKTFDTSTPLRRSNSVSLGRGVSSRLVLDAKKGYYTLLPRPTPVAASGYVPLYNSRPKSMSISRDFGTKSGYESDREEIVRTSRLRPRPVSFSHDIDINASRRTRSASLTRDISVKPKKDRDDEETCRDREFRARSMSLTRDTEELIRSLRESSTGRSDFADIEAYKSELYNKQKTDRRTEPKKCKRKQQRKDVKYETFTKHFADESKPIKEINPGLSMKAREIVNRQGYRYKVDQDLLNISMARKKEISLAVDDSEDEPYTFNSSKSKGKELKSDDEEEVSSEAFKRKMHLKNLHQFINRANVSFDDMEDSEVPSWRKEKLHDTGYDYTKHMARKNKVELFNFDDIRTSKLPVNRQQTRQRAQSVGPELESKNKLLNSIYDKERQALLKLGTNWVKDKPLSFIERLKSKSTLEGNSALLSCFVTGKEPFCVLWYRRGIALSRDEEENFHIRSNGGFLSLEIPVTSTYDTGDYMVEVRNEEGKIKSSCYLQIEPTFDPKVEYKHPEFVDPIHYVHVKLGQPASFSCRVSGNPAPFVRWFKDGIELQQTDRIDIHQGEKGQAFLLIHDTVEQDKGLYICEAQSMAGRCRSSATLQILESMADAFDDISCNMEVERIISKTKNEKGIVSETPKQKPKAWRAGLELEEPQAQKQENVPTQQTDETNEAPPKASEILTVLDETLKAGKVPQTTDLEVSLTTPAESHTKSETSELALTIPLSHNQSLPPSSALLEGEPESSLISHTVSNTEMSTLIATSSHLDTPVQLDPLMHKHTLTSNVTDVEKEKQKDVKEIMMVDHTDQEHGVTEKPLYDQHLVKIGEDQREFENIQTISRDMPSGKTELDSQPSWSQSGSWKSEAVSAVAETIETSEERVSETEENKSSNINSKLPLIQGSLKTEAIENRLLSETDTLSETFANEIDEVMEDIGSSKEQLSKTEIMNEKNTDRSQETPLAVVESGICKLEEKRDMDFINPNLQMDINEKQISKESIGGEKVPILTDATFDLQQLPTASEMSSTSPLAVVEAGICNLDEKRVTDVINTNQQIDVNEKQVSKESIDGEKVPALPDAMFDLQQIPTASEMPCTSPGPHATDAKEQVHMEVPQDEQENKQYNDEHVIPFVPLSPKSEIPTSTTTTPTTSLDASVDLSVACNSDPHALSQHTIAQDTSVHLEKSTVNVDEHIFTSQQVQENLKIMGETELFKTSGKHESSGSVMLSRDEEGNDLLVSAQRVSSPIEKKVKATEEAIEKPGSPEVTSGVEKAIAEEPSVDVTDGKKAVFADISSTEGKEKEEKVEKSSIGKDTAQDDVKKEKMDAEKVPVLKDIKGQEEQKEVSVAETVEEDTGTKEVPVPEEIKTQEEQKETSKPTADDTATEQVETQESVPKEEEREPQPPTFVKKLPEKIDLKDGEDLLLQCITDGLPKPEVIWMHENKTLEASKDIVIKDSHDVHSLEMKKVDHKFNSGVYTAKLVGGASTADQEQVVSTCKVFILNTAPVEKSIEVVEEGIKEKDILPLVERQISTEQDELKLQIPASVDLPEVCEEAQLDASEMHIPMVSPTGVHCHSSPLDKAEKGEELPLSKTSPHFAQPLDEELYPLERDENVRIQCVVAGEPCPEIVWFKDGVKLEQSSRVRLEWDPDTRIASVLLKRLHILDTGEYECIVYGENGSYSTKTTLHVKALEMQKVETIDRDDPPENEPPKVFLALKDKKVYQGKSTTLDCIIKGVPQPEIKWIRHGKEIVSRHGKYILTNMNQQYSLTIKDFKKTDEGCYSLEASNESGTCSSSAYLIMEAVEEVVETSKLENSLPEFTSKMEGTMTPLGGVVIFKCSASGYPVPKFKWQKDMLDIYQSRRITIDNNPGETTLTISDVTRRDGGMYVCIAKNNLGRIKQTAKLIVSEDCSETRRLSLSGEIDKPEEQTPTKSDSTDVVQEAPSTETSLEPVGESKEETAGVKEESPASTEEKTKQAEEEQAKEQIAVQEKPVVAQEEKSEAVENIVNEMTIEQGNHAATEKASVEEKPAVVQEKATSGEERITQETSTVVNDTQVQETPELISETPVHEKQAKIEEVSVQEKQIKADDVSIQKQPDVVDESPVQVPEEKMMSALKSVQSEEEASLTENVDFAKVENVSVIMKEKVTLDDQSLQKKSTLVNETDGEKTESIKETILDVKETVLKETEVSDKKTEKQTKTESLSIETNEGTAQRTVETIRSSETMSKTTDDGEFDIDHLVQQAETILGETVSMKTEEQDLSFEEVLAKSVLEESVVEAASEMEKINKNKKRKLSKSKRRSQSLEMEDTSSVKDLEEETAVKNTEVESETTIVRTVTDAESSSQNKNKTVSSAKTKSVSFEEVVEVSGSDAVDSKTISVSTSKVTTSRTKSTTVESHATDMSENIEEKSLKEIKVERKESASESTTAVKADNSASTTKLESRTLDRLMSMDDVKEILDVDTLKMNETREAIVEQKTPSGRTQVLEVSARRVSKQLSVEEQAAVSIHHPHVHHPPEIIVPPENQFVNLHSEIELTVKVRAAHGAKISWYHDGRQVEVTENSLKGIYGEHYELTEEELAEDK